MEDKKFYKGNCKEDGLEYPTSGGGWFMGYFVKEGFRKSDRIEIKWWEFTQGKIKDHENKIQFYATEITIILKGEIVGHINGEEINLKQGEYVIIPPRIENSFPENVISKKVVGITIKLPSLPSDKITSDNIKKIKEIFK